MCIAPVNKCIGMSCRPLVAHMLVLCLVCMVFITIIIARVSRLQPVLTGLCVFLRC